MEKVTGIGGLFFRAETPGSLAEWYRDNFGFDPVPADYETLPWQQQAGSTAFAPFDRETDYFGRSDQQWMINLRVLDLDAMVGQLRADGIEVIVDDTDYPNGLFARLSDPEGNPVELWEPEQPAD